MNREYNMSMMDDLARDIVWNYTINNLKYLISINDIYTVWKVKVLQNWKWLISTTVPDTRYYEVTYDGDKKQFYLDAYVKEHNETVPEDVAIDLIKLTTEE